MVRRLVEQQTSNEPRRIFAIEYAHLPAAAERADVAVDLLVGESETVQHLAGAALPARAAEC